MDFYPIRLHHQFRNGTRSGASAGEGAASFSEVSGEGAEPAATGYWRRVGIVGQRARQPRTTKIPWVVAAAGILVALVLGFVHFREPPLQKAVQRYLIAAPDNTTDLHSFAISFDGRLVAMAAEVNGKRQLWLRPLDALQAQPMLGTEDVPYPFWSPDSHYIGFFAQGKLKKIAVNGGPAQVLCDAPNGRGGSWNRDGVILLAPNSTLSAIQRVSAAGGVPVDVTARKGGPRFPAFLPDGRHFLYVAWAAGEEDGIYAASLDGKENRRILPDVSRVVFAAGTLLFVRDNTLMAQAFNSTSSRTVGEAFPVAQGASFSAGLARGQVTASETRVLLYQSGNVAANQMAWYDRGGKRLGTVGSPGRVSLRKSA